MIHQNTGESRNVYVQDDRDKSDVGQYKDMVRKALKRFVDFSGEINVSEDVPEGEVHYEYESYDSVYDNFLIMKTFFDFFNKTASQWEVKAVSEYNIAGILDGDIKMKVMTSIALASSSGEIIMDIDADTLVFYRLYINVEDVSFDDIHTDALQEAIYVYYDSIMREMGEAEKDGGVVQEYDQDFDSVAVWVNGNELNILP